MQTALWNVIQLFNEREDIEVKELEVAKNMLDDKTFALLLEHFEGKLEIRSEQWL
ncbi:hypothetical protein JIN86_20365 [Lysinibacillus sp. HST-98]|uniref:hypothetical protein n=1 Tax=Lysinibacillus sp. HST-98 TaxID=2800419 RepID=UPI00192845C5|nr:hypothetical protein [Lysinibacillus sp. HST-98]MBL3731924.1 hypothetical protein [Lysinibacillus sp. HST-98]